MINYLGIFAQKASALGAAKSDGYNLAVICPEGETKDNWRGTCRSLGLSYIDTPSANPVADALDPLFLGWALPDEPRSLRGTLPGMAPLPYRTLCSNLRASHPTKRLFGNFAGTDLTSGYPWYKGDKDIPYFGPAGGIDSLTDIAADWYPCNRGYPDDLITRQLDLLKLWTNGSRRYWAILECSDQQLPLGSDKIKRPISSQEIISQAQMAVTWGVEGIIHFAASPQPHFSYDARTPEQRAGCKSVASMFLRPTPANPPIDPYDQRLKLLEAKSRMYDAVLNSISQTLTGGQNV